jgi:hypothetical protein
MVTLIALSIAVALAVGCGTAPNAPQPAATASLNSAGRAAEPAGLLDGAGSLLGGVATLVKRTIYLVGSVGGSLANGRWRVAIPANAVDGNATVTLTVASATSPVCQLDIAPATLNHFDTPVTLTIDCGSVATSDLKNWQMYWYNPAKAGWEPVAGSKVDLTAKTVSAPLSHFSQYAAGPAGGKAGW